MLFVGIISKAMLVTAILTVSNVIASSTRKDQRNLQKLGSINNKLAFKLLRKLTAEDEAQNIFISPLSISMTLAILCYGAEGNTSKELETVLGYQNVGMTKELVHLTFKHFLKSELWKYIFTLNIANVVLLNNELPLSPVLKNEIQETYFANLTSVDFRTNTSEVLNDINNWVERQTDGKISQFLDSIDPQTVFIILNAVYFKSVWKHPFDPKESDLKKFMNNNLKSKATFVPMMQMTRRIRTTIVSEFEVLELPYFQDNVVMLIMLPKQGVKFYERKLSHGVIVRILNSLRFRKTSVIVPKFKIDFRKSLIHELKNLGLKTVFDRGDFSRMVPNSTIPMSEFLHSAVIEVNEEGTEAVAVTSSLVKKSLIPFFHVNRPFAFAIIDKTSRFILFLGRVDKL